MEERRRHFRAVYQSSCPLRIHDPDNNNYSPFEEATYKGRPSNVDNYIGGSRGSYQIGLTDGHHRSNQGQLLNDEHTVYGPTFPKSPSLPPPESVGPGTPSTSRKSFGY